MHSTCQRLDPIRPHPYAGGMARDFPLELPTHGNGPYRVLRGLNSNLVEAFSDSLRRPEEAQRKRLGVLLGGARDTAFGRDHHLKDVETLEDWREAVPMRTHSSLSAYLDRIAKGEADVLTRDRVQMLLETSGTTGSPKHLPCTASWAEGVRQAQALWLLCLIRDHEEITRNRALTVVSAAEHARSEGGLPIGSNTGRMQRAQPWFVRMRFPVPEAVLDIRDASARQYATLRFALQHRLSTITTANPSTLLLLARRLVEWREPLSADLAAGTCRHGPAEKLSPPVRRRLWWWLRRRPVPTDWRPAALWPDLVTLNCWTGGSAAYFVERLPSAMGAALPVREVGITASEGYFAVPLGAGWGGGALWLLGHLLEFVAEDGSLKWAWELEQGDRVRLVISTEAGLYRYDLQDTLEVIGFCEHTPVVRFVGKSGRFLNTTGEKVTEAQVSEAMRRAARSTGITPVGFTVRAVLAERPFFEVLVEPGDGASVLLTAFDEALQAVNLEYASKRRSSRLAAPVVVPASAGTYTRFRSARVAAGAPEGQVKDPVVAISDLEWHRVVEAAEAP